MDMKRRQYIEYSTVVESANEFLSTVREINLSERAYKLITEKDRQEIERSAAILKDKLAQPFSLVILGEFKRGKSTLINALLGENVVPSAITPETITINRIFYGDEPDVSIITQSGKRYRLDADELRRKKLEGIIEQLGESVRYIDVKKPCKWLEELMIVDTPGMGDMFARFDEEVISYVARADALLYVTSALAPLSASEQRALHAVLPTNNFCRLFVIMNMADCLDSMNEARDILKLVDERTSAISPDSSCFAISALDQLALETGAKRPNPLMAEELESSYLIFKNSLEQDIILQREVIKGERIVSAMEQTAAVIKTRMDSAFELLSKKDDELTLLREEYTKKREEILKTVEGVRSEFSKDALRVKTEAKDWMSEFMDRLEAEIKAQENKPTETLRKHLQFYLIDMLKEGLESCLSEHRAQMLQRIREIAGDMAIELPEVGFTMADVGSNVRLADESWTKHDTGMLVVNQAAVQIPILSIIKPITNTIGGALREREMSKHQLDVVKPLLESFSKVRNDVFAAIDRVYDELAEALVERAKTLYDERISEALAGIDNVAEQSAQQEDYKRNARERFDYIYSLIDTLNSIVAELREEKWE